jgi:hemoglobin-like flavoprotein
MVSREPTLRASSSSSPVNVQPNNPEEFNLIQSSQVDLVQSSFDKVLPIADVAADIFYSRLFELDPSLRRLFHGDLRLQGKKLMETLRIIVGNLNRLDRIIPGVRALGERHVAYGVEEKHYDTVGAALLWTLERGLGEAFTADVRSAWASAYVVLAGAMKSARPALAISA